MAFNDASRRALCINVSLLLYLFSVFSPFTSFSVGLRLAVVFCALIYCSGRPVRFGSWRERFREGDCKGLRR